MQTDHCYKNEFLCSFLERTLTANSARFTIMQWFFNRFLNTQMLITYGNKFWRDWNCGQFLNYPRICSNFPYRYAGKNVSVGIAKITNWKGETGIFSRNVNHEKSFGRIKEMTFTGWNLEVLGFFLSVNCTVLLIIRKQINIKKCKFDGQSLSVIL